MSVRVNLLPGEVAARERANRARVGAGLLGVLLLLVLGGVTWMQRSSIADAKEQLAEVEARNDELNGDIAALQPFADLEARADASVEVLTLALGSEGSLATILQDLSAVLPPNAEIDTLAVDLSDEAQSPAVGGDRLAFGSLTATGRVVDGLAPGVERLIIDLDRVAAFDNAFVTTSTVDEEGVATFTIEVDLGPETLTNRYVVTDGEGSE